MLTYSIVHLPVVESTFSIDAVQQFNSIDSCHLQPSKWGGDLHAHYWNRVLSISCFPRNLVILVLETLPPWDVRWRGRGLWPWVGWGAPCTRPRTSDRTAATPPPPAGESPPPPESQSRAPRRPRAFEFWLFLQRWRFWCDLSNFILLEQNDFITFFSFAGGHLMHIHSLLCMKSHSQFVSVLFA